MYKCTASVAVHKICSILAKNIAPELIRFPIEKKRFYQKLPENFWNVLAFFKWLVVWTVPTSQLNNLWKIHTIIFDIKLSTHKIVKQPAMLMGNFNLVYKKLLPGHEEVPQLLLDDPA